jgi:hypothetical protein
MDSTSTEGLLAKVIPFRPRASPPVSRPNHDPEVQRRIESSLDRARQMRDDIVGRIEKELADQLGIGAGEPEAPLP